MGYLIVDFLDTNSYMMIKDLDKGKYSGGNVQFRKVHLPVYEPYVLYTE